MIATAIVCFTVLAAYVVQALLRWLRDREERRMEILERMLPLDAGTPEYILAVVEVFADAPRSDLGREQIRLAVLRARRERLDGRVGENDAVMSRLTALFKARPAAPVAAPRRRWFP